VVVACANTPTRLINPKRKSMPDQPEISVVMPCLNEAETLAVCIRKAMEGLRTAEVSGEVVIADNGSTDGSQRIAEECGARVIPVAAKGYGNALRGGISAACGRWVIMGDADDSYDFSQIRPFVEKLREGNDLVMGCRMPSGGGMIKPGAMPWKHRWIGNPALSFIGRLFFKCPARDFHCGLRAFSKTAFERIDMRTTGMEFASEMVIKATLHGLRIAEVPITLHPDGRSRAPHLRSWRDGWRHLRFMLLFSPRWLFLYPGILLSILGLLGHILLVTGEFRIGKIVLSTGSLMASSMLLLVGIQLMSFAFFTKVFAVSEGLLPPNKTLLRIQKAVTLEWGMAFGLFLAAIGILLFGGALRNWQLVGFQALSLSENLHRIIPASTLIVSGTQILFGSFFIGVLGLKSRE
jgi:glycosyltransferase involved in cell wall biosynthesis